MSGFDSSRPEESARKATAYVVLTDPDTSRADLWREMLGTLEIPVQSSWMEARKIPGEPNPVMSYLLDIEALSPDQQERVVARLAQRFGMPVDQAKEAFKKQGVPIPAKGTRMQTELAE